MLLGKRQAATRLVLLSSKKLKIEKVKSSNE
jgi:hypothetical protein